MRDRFRNPVAVLDPCAARLALHGRPKPLQRTPLLQDFCIAITLTTMPNNRNPFFDRPSFPPFVVGTAVILILLDYGLGEGWLSWTYWQQGGLNTSRSEVLRNLGLLALGVVGSFYGIWRSVIALMNVRAAQEQGRIAEQGNNADRFAKAAEMLSDDNPRVRTGAIRALARLAQDSVDRDHIPVMEVLTEFIRIPPYQEAAKRAEARREAENARKEENDAGANTDMPPPVQCPDIHAALQVIAERNDAQKERENKVYFKPSLTRAKLRELDLRDANLTEAELSDANLTGADLAYATLTNASLDFADLTSANLDGANLTGADLAFANLTGASLDFAKGLTQEQIADCRPSASPINLPDDLDWPFVKENGEWVNKE